MKRLIFFCWVLAFLPGCEPENLFGLPDAPLRLTILSYNQVGEPWAVVLASTRQFYHNRREILEDTQVSIYEDGNFLEQLKLDTINPRYDQLGLSSQTSSPRPGHEYKIVVEAARLPTATATYIQPEIVPADITCTFRKLENYKAFIATNNGPIQEVSFDSIFTATFDVSITFTDPPGENFYDFWVVTSDKEDFSQATTSSSGYLPIEYSIFTDPVKVGHLIDDKLISGQQVTRKFTYKLTYSLEKKPMAWLNFPKQEWFTISLRTMPKEVYKFITQTRKAQMSSYDPYAQPYTTYTNVEGGVGVFGGFTASSKTFHYEIEE